MIRLVLHNVTVKPFRLALTALAVAMGVLAVVSLAVVTASLKTTDLALLQTGRADFTVAQKSVADLLSSSIDAATAARVAKVPGVADLTGVLIATTRLNASNPQFLEIGIAPGQLGPFGVTVVAGRPFSADATDQVLLGYIAAQDLGLHVGDNLRMDNNVYHIVGIYSTGQSLGDAGAMLPLAWFQTLQREPSQYTLLFVRVAPGAAVQRVQDRVDASFPEIRGNFGLALDERCPMTSYRLRKSALVSVLATGALLAVPGANALASGPPPAATAFATAIIGPAGGSFSGFGITVTFAPGAVAHQDLVVLGNWPNGLDVTPPSGQAVKTFGLQVCDDSTGTPTNCTSEFGNYPNSPAGTERIDGKQLAFTGYQGTTVNFGNATDKLVSFTVRTGGDAVYIYNPNFSVTSEAYPKLLPSSSGNGVLRFMTFQPIVWTVTSPGGSA